VLLGESPRESLLKALRCIRRLSQKDGMIEPHNTTHAVRPIPAILLRLAWIIHEKERNALEMRPIAVITSKAIWASFDTLSLSLSAPKWAETRVQTVFHAIDPQNS
jgi:hypothetical protein